MFLLVFQVAVTTTETSSPAAMGRPTGAGGCLAAATGLSTPSTIHAATVGSASVEGCGAATEEHSNPSITRAAADGCIWVVGSGAAERSLTIVTAKRVAGES